MANQFSRGNPILSAGVRKSANGIRRNHPCGTTASRRLGYTNWLRRVFGKRSYAYMLSSQAGELRSTPRRPSSERRRWPADSTFGRWGNHERTTGVIIQ
jgi:hypothetical protein